MCRHIKLIKKAIEEKTNQLNASSTVAESCSENGEKAEENKELEAGSFFY